MKKEAEVIRIKDLTRNGIFCNITFRSLIRMIFKNLYNISNLKQTKEDMLEIIEEISSERIEEIEEIDKL